MLTHAFTCTGPYAVLIATGLKAVENRSARPEPSKGRCALSCSKSFCAAEYGRFVEWASRSLPSEDFKLLPSWADVCDWPGKVIGCCDYEVRSKNEEAKSAGGGRSIHLQEGSPSIVHLHLSPSPEPREAWDEGYEYWWELSNVTVFDQPIPCRGNVGMWEMPHELAAKVSVADEMARMCENPIRTAEDAVHLFRLAMPIVGGVEGFFVLPLDGERKPLCAPVLVSMGTEPNTTAVSTGDVFREALKVGAEAIVVAHNHPGGTLKPSPDDVTLTRELSKASELLGVKLLDHLIVTKDGFARVE